MRHLLLTRGAKRRQDVFVGLSVHIRKPEVCLFTEACKCFSLVPRRVASRLLKLSQLRVLALGWQSLRGADLAARGSQLPASGPDKAVAVAVAVENARKLGVCCLAQPGQTPKQKTHQERKHKQSQAAARAQSEAQKTPAKA